jgi:two-component system, HptB-dependent secretion and biofilm response regulator
MNLSPVNQSAALKVLVIDDDAITRTLLVGIVRQHGYKVVQAANGVEGMRKFEIESPDLVLTDMNMPVMDGFGVIESIREIASGRWLPIVAVTGANEIETQVRALKCGADDYMVKPIDAAILGAKLTAISRAVSLQREVEIKNSSLEDYRDTAEEEGRVATHLIRRLVNANQLDDPMLDHFILPAANYSGDLVAAARTQRGVLHVLLADATGHGLAAAIAALPIVPCFYAMTAKDLSIDLIAAEMNRVVKQYLPVSRFVAATLIAVDEAVQRVTVWNGANPPLLAFDADDHLFARLSSRNLALGILPPKSFTAAVDSFDYDGPCQLVACSDGVIDDRDEVDGTDGQTRLERILGGAPASVRMKMLRSRLVARCAEKPASDDMTVVMIRCGASCAAPAGRAGANTCAV